MSKNMYLMSKYDICIPNAQYSSLSAQQNLWCEILEFWVVIVNLLTTSALYSQQAEHAKNSITKPACLCCKRATFALQNINCYDTIEPLLRSNSRSIGVQKRLFWYFRVLSALHNPTKTATWFPIINFIFVTCFYSCTIFALADTKTYHTPNSNSWFTHCLRRNRRNSLIPHKHFIQRL